MTNIVQECEKGKIPSAFGCIDINIPEKSSSISSVLDTNNQILIAPRPSVAELVPVVNTSINMGPIPTQTNNNITSNASPIIVS